MYQDGDTHLGNLLRKRTIVVKSNEKKKCIEAYRLGDVLWNRREELIYFVEFD